MKAALLSLLLTACAEAKPTKANVAYTPQNLQFGPFSETLYDGCGNWTEIHRFILLPGSQEWVHEIRRRGGKVERRVFPVINFRTGVSK